ncbi:uncharacterized protein HD556DRAFT_1431037 [Suillus plorans]|uniref:CxC2-like cysteine cluster KDZ transposase-associated domain-containing protein n=1 Tax=Suillus plorans TaxID=116603 RepID=A0A9P7DLK9_9AGAM|nr:uncharacterized protein HD556DRAFT_1431037 [Suillus plorans]KAG1797829.1 hypothetical protein HD556DRAFT_1431037 [Suillus plorans]
MSIFASGNLGWRIIWICSWNERLHLQIGLPFHRTSQWNGDFFDRTTLAKLGVEIHLGHGGQPCPNHNWEWEDTDDEDRYTASLTAGIPAYEDVFLESEPAATFPDLPEVNTAQIGRTTLTIVHSSGVHISSLFEIGLFAASFTRPKTAFTFALLDDFILDNLECGTSGMNYYSKLRRITSSLFPHAVPDCYREMMRVARQWRQLKLLKWNGFGHEKREPKDGELALFCPACPQPGINAPLQPESDETTHGWIYTCSLVMDSNFKAEHLYPTHPEDEVWLTDSKGFMVGRVRYQAHLAVAQDSAQRSECNNHRAVNQANASRHKLEATGISGCMCARHGCFVPNSMVDFQKGERQMNMDYALCNALAHNTDGLCRALTFYDVNCYGMFMGIKTNALKDIELDLLETSVRRPGVRPQIGSATWLASGITIEEMQLALAMDLRRMGWHPTEMQTLDIGRHRVRLQQSIDEFTAGAARYIGDEYDADDGITIMDVEFVEDGTNTQDCSEDDLDAGENTPRVSLRPETIAIPLPSNFSKTRCEELGIEALVRQETLHEGQANDILHTIRVHLADKSVLFWTVVRPAKSQASTTWAWAQVHSVKHVINLNSMIYKKCRSQLSNLGAYHMLQKYRLLERTELKANSAVADPNIRGQRNLTLPWFRSLDVQGDLVSNDWLNEWCIGFVQKLCETTGPKS